MEIALHTHLIRRHKLQHQVIPQSLHQRHLRAAQVAVLHHIRIRLIRARLVVVDRGAPTTPADAIEIIAATSRQVVVATARDQRVVPQITVQPVIAAAALEVVVAPIALQHVIAGTTEEPIIQPRSLQGVVACQAINPVRHVAVAAQLIGTSRGATHHHPRPQLPITPQHRITEADALHPGGGIGEVLENPDRVTAANADHQIGIESLDGDLGGGNIQPTQLIPSAILIKQRVAAIATCHHIEIIARPSAENVITAAALENVIPRLTREDIGASISLNPVGGS